MEKHRDCTGNYHHSFILSFKRKKKGGYKGMLIKSRYMSPPPHSPMHWHLAWLAVSHLDLQSSWSAPATVTETSNQQPAVCLDIIQPINGRCNKAERTWSLVEEAVTGPLTRRLARRVSVCEVNRCAIGSWWGAYAGWNEIPLCPCRSEDVTVFCPWDVGTWWKWGHL